VISVAQALDAVFALVRPVGTEVVPLARAAGRVMAGPAEARRDQPPFAASAMDGYALAGDPATSGTSLPVVGEAAAGHGYSGKLGAGQALRIFTGAPLPDGADRVVIQENVQRAGARIRLDTDVAPGANIRPAAGDFAAGDIFRPARPLGPSDLALLAAMNQASVTVARRPDVALIATGDELVLPGETPGPDQIVASNIFGLQALVAANGGTARILPVARDNLDALRGVFALAAGADLIVTIGGASVGDHDLVAEAAAQDGLRRSFYKVAMRPGKPLMAGHMGRAAMLGLPGNPVSAMVCGHIFLVPALRAMQGLAAEPAPRQTARLRGALPANGPREHYMRARVDDGILTAFASQDSALLSVLSQANALLVRPPDTPPLQDGASVAWIAV